MILLEVKNVTKKFGDKVILKNISFTLEEGESLGILGKSGAGKSVFMGSLLALFGLSNIQADISEVVLKKSLNLNLESFDNDEDEITIRAIKKEKIRYFLNDLTISKKRLSELVSPLVRHISQRSNNELSSELLLGLLDAESAKNSEDYVKRVKNFKEMYDLYRRKLLRLQEMKAEQYPPKVIQQIQTLPQKNWSDLTNQMYNLANKEVKEQIQESLNDKS